MINSLKSQFFFICFFALSSQTFAQLSLAQLVEVKFGQTFFESKNEIKKMFTQKPSIMKADFFGAYQIQYEETPFSYYGNGDYIFQYAKDSLVSVKVQFSFEADDTLKFRRLYNTMMEDFTADKSKKLLTQYSDLNSTKIFSYIKANCKTTTDKSEKNYKPIKTKFLGQNFWAIYNQSLYTGKVLHLSVQLIERHLSKSENGRTVKYDGAVVEATLEIFSEEFQSLKNREEQLEITNYRIIKD